MRVIPHSYERVAKAYFNSPPRFFFFFHSLLLKPLTNLLCLVILANADGSQKEVNSFFVRLLLLLFPLFSREKLDRGRLGNVIFFFFLSVKKFRKRYIYFT